MSGPWLPRSRPSSPPVTWRQRPHYRSDFVGLVVAVVVALAIAAAVVAALTLVDDPTDNGYPTSGRSGADSPATMALPWLPVDPTVPPPVD